MPVYREVSKFQPVRRDLAVLVDETLNAQSILDALNEKLPAFVNGIELFDVYRGKGIEPGKKSLAFRVLMQDTQKTLTENEIEENIRVWLQCCNDMARSCERKRGI